MTSPTLLPRSKARAALSASVIVTVAVLMISGNADWFAPPRFDGAGYAVLARALLNGQGYRAIDHPDTPRHAHFPPGYPVVLAAVWRLTGESSVAAHRFSALLTLGACVAAWWWFRAIIGKNAALVLALALAVNWLWARTASMILSEPLFMLLSQVAILSFIKTTRHASPRVAHLCISSTILAACLLTRHVAIGLILAVLIEFVLRKRWRQGFIVVAVTAALSAPWMVWLMTAGKDGGTQANLLMRSDSPLEQRIPLQLLFYIQRIPDQICGPLVEVGAASERLAGIANLWAILATGIILFGWIRMVRQPRKRLPALISFCTLAILIVWPFTEAGRFLIPLIPNLLIGGLEGAVGVVRCLESMGWKRIRRSRLQLYAACFILVLSAPYTAYALVSGRTRAQEALHSNFDAACHWITTHADRAGPILSRHPGEVFWQTGRQSVEAPMAIGSDEPNDDSSMVARTIQKYRIPYLLLDQDRYAHSPTSTLEFFVASHPDRVRKVFQTESGRSSISIYEVNPDR